MADRDAAFVGSIPEKYDRSLGPIYFHRYADDLAARLPVTPKMRVLEMACGTGILTERLVRRLGGQGTVVATDLNEPMIVYAQQKGFGDSGLEWRRADATKLPFEDTSFEAALCQFGLMFFPDKIAGLCEAFRVLKPGGHYLFSTWDSVEHNTIGKITHETVASFFPADPPQFYLVPFSLHDPALIRGWLDRVGFRIVECHTVNKVGVSPAAGGGPEAPGPGDRADDGGWHRPSAVRVWRFWLDDRITRLESLRCSLRSSLGPRTEHAREPGEADRTPTRAASGGTGIG